MFKHWQRNIRKLQWIRSKNLPAIALILVLVGLCAYMLGWSKLLVVKKIDLSASGNEVLISQIIEPGDLHLGLPLARVNVSKINRDLSGQKWIKSLKINRHWASGNVSITVIPRIPVARYEVNGAVNYFDSQGISFAAPSAPNGLPLITFTSQDQASKQAVADFLTKIPTDFLTGMSDLQVLSAESIMMTTSLPGFSSLEISWGSPTQLPLKINVLRHLLALGDNAKVIRVDLTNPLAPVTSTK